VSTYVVLNFEDRIDAADAGAAEATIRGLTNRYTGRKGPKTAWGKRHFPNAVIEHRCVEPGPAKALTTDAGRLAAMRRDCTAATKIYLVMHGDPRQTDKCFTNATPATAGVVELTHPKGIAQFLNRVLGARRTAYRVALIMCYGARCRRYLTADVHHQKRIANADLVTSFAYRLFHELVDTYSLDVRLSAVTGKISHEESSGRAMVEVDEMIDVSMAFSDAVRDRKDAMTAAVGGALLPLNEQSPAYKQQVEDWKASPDGVAKNQAYVDARLAKDAMAGQLGARSFGLAKYGKIEYRKWGRGIRIASRYGDTTTGLRAGAVLYSGPILAPIY
jgi:hypothetical protein